MYFVHHQVHREARRRCRLLDVAGECGTESDPRLDVGTQVEDAQTQFADDASHFGVGCRRRGPVPAVPLQIGHEDIERVADACQLLGDPVMDLAGEPPPLLLQVAAVRTSAKSRPVSIRSAAPAPGIACLRAAMSNGWSGSAGPRHRPGVSPASGDERFLFHAVGHHPRPQTGLPSRRWVSEVTSRVGRVAFGATHGVGHQLVVLVDVQDRSLGWDVPGELLERLLGQCDLVESGGQLS